MKLFSYKELYKLYYKTIPGLELDNGDNIIQFVRKIYRKIYVCVSAESGRQEIKFKRNKNQSRIQKRENSMIYEVDSINVIQETLKTSQKPDSPKGRNVFQMADFSISKEIANRRSMALQSSVGKSLEVGKFVKKTFVNATLSQIAFNKQKQKRMKREIKMRKTLQLRDKKLIPTLAAKEMDDLVTIEESKKNDIVEESETDLNERDTVRKVNPKDLQEHRQVINKLVPKGRNKSGFASPEPSERGITSSTFSRDIDSSTPNKIYKPSTPMKSDRSKFSCRGSPAGKPPLSKPSKSNVCEPKTPEIVTAQKIARGFLARRNYKWLRSFKSQM